LFYLPDLVILLFMNLFVYKVPFHRKHVRLKCVLDLLLDALFLLQILFPASATLKLLSPS
jgi:hypothetical protein